MKQIEQTTRPPIQIPRPKPDVDDLIFSWQAAKGASER